MEQKLKEHDPWMVLAVNRILNDFLPSGKSRILPEDSLERDFVLDSMDTIELCMELEQEFGIAIPDKEMTALKTVEEVYAFIERQKEVR